MPTCNISSSGPNIQQQLTASDLPEPNRLQSKALVALPEALVPDSDPLVSESKALLSVSESFVSDSKNFAASISEVCKLRAFTVSQLSALSGSVYTACAMQPLAISSGDDLLTQPSQKASTSLAHYTPLTEQHAAAPSIKILMASEYAVDTAANSLILSFMSSVFQDIVCTASAAAAGAPAVLLASEVPHSIMQMMPANSTLQATMVTEVADSIFFRANVTNITFSIVQHAAWLYITTPCQLCVLL